MFQDMLILNDAYIAGDVPFVRIWSRVGVVVELRFCRTEQMSVQRAR